MTPQSDWPAFQVPTCVCGHAVGDHKSGGSSFPWPPVIGVCLRCDCKQFVEVAPEKKAGEAA